MQESAELGTKQVMLGFYRKFPLSAHTTLNFKTPISTRRFQETIIKLFSRLNTEKLPLETIADPSIHNCEAQFRIGIADSTRTSYLNELATKSVLKVIHKTVLPKTDFQIIIQYYQIKNNDRSPLRFDHYLIRFSFDLTPPELRIFHERGPRHLQPEELCDFILHKINESSLKKIMKPLTEL